MAFLDYLLQSLYATLLTFVLAFGIPLILAFLQNLISSYNERMGYRIMGRKFYRVFVARIGVPVHELGHAVFALLFRHKITEMKLYQSDNQSGTLGYVNHTYNRRSLYQNIGNFFMGIGPVIFGSLILYVLAVLLFNVAIGENVEAEQESAGQAGIIIAGGWNLIREIFTSGSFLKSSVFLYLVFAIGSNITLSKADLKGAYKGFGFLMLFLFIMHFAILWLVESSTGIATYMGRLAAGFTVILGVAILLNLLFSLILFAFSRILRR